MQPNLSPAIQALSSEVIDQIAAGEVVERPAHLVKELVENSLDAHASEVIVEVSEGGRHIVVKDNGKGIRPSELSTALDRHTTSKILRTDDLWNLSTYGFRGEALASIAAVSRLTLSSKIEGEETGARLEAEFGRKGPVDRIGHTTGTRIQIRELFENVPARLKFMKSAAGEITAIRNVIKAMSLARPEVAFQMFVEGRLDLHYTSAAGRKQRAEQVFGITPLYEGRATRDGVTAYSVMGDPNQTAKTSKNIWIMAQNRWIQDRALQTAAVEAYRTMLMHGEYPFVVTWVETPPDQIDVNIHPTKSQVKFAEPSLAFRAVSASVRETLERAPWVQQILRGTASAPVVSAEPLPENLTFEGADLQKTQYQVKPTLQTLRDGTAQPVYQARVSENSVPLTVQDLRETRERLEAMGAGESERSLGQWAGLQVLGQANLTYIICQKREGLVFVDQHAAHERVLFEKIMQAWKNGHVEVQEFLFPLSMDLSPDKKEALLKSADDFAKLGVHLEEMGPQTIGVRAAPLWIKEASLPKVLDQAATQMVDQGGSFVFETYVGDLAATMACHSAIRAGQSLSPDEMHALLASMDEFTMSSFCPHGRPVSVEYGFAKLEKDFGRTLS
ncbi:MAG: DNA mismatch repair endonuclease MutL [Bdellovibrionaceae bacterium]|nr:DNA mismatch repair endonuclease MutL [Pseudobdellovibrionaceae bacterium]